MKILHCVGWTDTGLHYRQNYYVNELSKSVEVILLTSSSAHKRTFQTSVDRVESNEPRYLIRRHALFDWKGMIVFKFMDVFESFKPDVVHLYEASQGVTYLLAKACVRMNIPYVYEHEQRSDGTTIFRILQAKLLTKPWVRFAARNAGLVRVVTPGAAEYIGRISGRQNCYIGTLAYDPQRSFYSAELRESFRREFALGRKTALCITGTFPIEKRIDVLVEAFCAASMVRKDLMLFVAGSIQAAIKEKLQLQGVSNNVVYFGRMLNGEQLNRLFCGCDAAIWTKPTISFFEAIGTGLKIYIPFGSGTSHLDGKLVNHYGKNGGIEWSETVVEDGETIKEELVHLILGMTQSTLRTPDERFSSPNIARELLSQYVTIHNGQKAN